MAVWNCWNRNGAGAGHVTGVYHPAAVDDGVAAFQPGRWQRPCAAFLNQEVTMKCPSIHLLIDRRNMALRGLLSNGGVLLVTCQKSGDPDCRTQSAVRSPRLHRGEAFRAVSLIYSCRDRPGPPRRLLRFGSSGTPARWLLGW